MSMLYITDQGAIITKTGERLVVKKARKEIFEIECFKLDTVLLCGNVQFTTQAARQMLKHGIEMALLTLDGEIIGQLTPPMPKNVLLRIGQMEALSDEKFLLSMARSIVAAKVLNCSTVLREYHRNYPGDDLKRVIGALKAAQREIAKAETIDGLFGIEGNAARIYWKGFSLVCLSDLKFDKRTRRPPKDPVNSLLSLGYTIVFNRIQGLLDGVGLDPYVGFFHKPKYGRPSLAADILEEFRGPLVDRFTLFLINKRVLTSSSFEPHEESGGIRLTRDGMKTYFEYFEKYMDKNRAGFDDPEMDFNAIIIRQVGRMVKAIKRIEAYEPFRLLFR
ncbi:CRISPR-associated endonuclease Cas1 [Candidatus Micrarchaeota archaeon]|nr:CRISPR-associated endonuclease Cas1 [Candidatus Micrarchaeota archaeon]